MSLTLLRDGLDVAVNQHRATGNFLFDTVADLPAKGSSATWVAVGEDDLGGDWHVDDLEVQPGVLNMVRITARQPGHDWTWVDGSGDPLRPVVTRNTYDLWTANMVVDGVVNLGYWHVFSNWPAAENFTTADPDPLQDSLRTWEIEFVASISYQDWHYRANGSWPTGISSWVPTAGNGIYWCRDIQIEDLVYIAPVTGTSTTLYRHFALFWEAPSIDGTQLTWVYDQWT